MRLLATLLVGSLALIGAPSIARADDLAAASTVHVHLHHHGGRHHPPTLSMGYANGGRLVNGLRLDEDDTLRYLPNRVLHYGTDELIALIQRSARAVQRRFHARLTVGDLSAPRGGPVGHHASHQSGRDADIAFYVCNRHGDPVLTDDLVPFRADGTPLEGNEGLRFDVPRNWALIDALVTDPLVHVEHVFVYNPLRSQLLDYARTHDASAAAIARAEAVMHQPVHGAAHNNHFHVRISCPSGDGACIAGVRLPPRRHHRATAIAHLSPVHHDRARALAAPASRSAHAPVPANPTREEPPANAPSTDDPGGGADDER